MGFLTDLFGKKQSNNGVPITLDICESGFAVNCVSFPLPTTVSELIEVLGQPRIAEKQHMPQSDKVYCEKYGYNPDVYNPREYYWDDMGIFVCSLDGETVHSLFIHLRKTKYPFPMPKCYFSGTLLIMGKPFEEVAMRDGRLRYSVPYDRQHLRISCYGRQSNPRSARVVELALNSDVQEELFRNMQI